MRPFYGNCRTLHIIDAKLGAGVLPKIELGQVAVEMLCIDVLVGADQGLA